MEKIFNSERTLRHMLFTRGCAVLLLILSLISLGWLSGCSGSITPADVMIYEVYTSGGYSGGESYAPYKNCYVVLYNGTDEEKDLTGWSLRVSLNNSTIVNEKKTVKLEGKVGPRQFYVVQGGSASDAPDKPVGDALDFKTDIKASNFRLVRKSGIIALCNEKGANASKIKASSGFVVDYFSYCNIESQSAKLYEGTGPATGNTVKKIFRRVTFTDNNDNATDFETKDIVDKPAGIIRYKKGMTGEDAMRMLPPAKAPKLNFSHTPGYYQKEFKLSLRTDMKKSPKIYYTLDGSQPIYPSGRISATAKLYNNNAKIRIYDRTGEDTALMDATGLMHPDFDDASVMWPPAKNPGESSSAYNARMTSLYRSVYKVNVIRAAAINDDKSITPTVSGSFFVGSKNFAQRYDMPVISIFVNRDDLFNKKTGIFVFKNIEDRSVTAGRPGVIQFFEKSGKLAFEETFELRLNGGYTRRFPQKSLRVNMSNDLFNYDLFDGTNKDINGKVITYYDRFVLRSGGNDWRGGAMRDWFWQTYCSQLGSFDTQACRPVAVFLNGEFWGRYNMLDRQDEYNIAAHYGIDKKDAAIIEGFFSAQTEQPDIQTEVTDLRTFVIENNMKKTANYKRFTDAMDMDSFIDYFICELYAGNTDWPHNNLKMWKSVNPDDKYDKWRMMMQDVDFGFSSVTGPDQDCMNFILKEDKHENSLMFASLFKNKSFKKKFIKRFEFLLDKFFVKDKMMSHLNGLKGQVQVSTPEHRARWDLPMDQWYGTFTYIDDFLSRRNAAVRKSLNKVK